MSNQAQQENQQAKTLEGFRPTRTKFGSCGQQRRFLLSKKEGLLKDLSHCHFWFMGVDVKM